MLIFLTEMSVAKTCAQAFEVSSREYMSSSNHKTLKDLHKLCKNNIKLSILKKNISSLSLFSSYHIWLCRNDMNFVQPPYLRATFRETLFTSPLLYNIIILQARGGPACWPAMFLVLVLHNKTARYLGGLLVANVFIKLLYCK